MTRQIDENLLLGYIEDELTPEETARVRAAIAADPEVAEHVEQMREHRAMLCDDPEPAVPADLLSGIEARLARPLLIDSASDGADRAALLGQPGAPPRPHRPARRRLAPLAVAAMLLFALLAGVWTALTLWPGSTLPGTPPGTDHATQPQEQIAVATPDLQGQLETSAHDERDEQSVTTETPLVETAQTVVAPSAIQPGIEPVGTVEPASTQSGSGQGVDVGSDSAMATDEPAHSHAPHEPAGDLITNETFIIESMLVIDGADASQIEQSLEAAAAHLQHASLVQNLRYETARQLEQLWIRAASERRLAERSDQLLQEVVDPAQDFNLLAERVQQQMAREAHRDGAVGSETLDGHRAGSPMLAPSLAQQLAFSSGGASHTLTLPVVEVEALLVQLAVERGFETKFVPLEEQTDQRMGNGAAALTQERGIPWPEHLRDTRRLLERFERLDPRGMIHLPIRIEPAAH